MSVRLWVGADKRGCSSKRMDPTSTRGRTFNVEGERLSIVGGFGDADAPGTVLSFEHMPPLGRKRLRGVSALDHGWNGRVGLVQFGLKLIDGEGDAADATWGRSAGL